MLQYLLLAGRTFQQKKKKNKIAMKENVCVIFCDIANTVRTKIKNNFA